MTYRLARSGNNLTDTKHKGFTFLYLYFSKFLPADANYLCHKQLSNNWVNSLATSDALWVHETWSSLFQVMAWCHQAPSHYLNQCWCIIDRVPWHAHQKYASEINCYNFFEYCKFRNTPGAKELTGKKHPAVSGSNGNQCLLVPGIKIDLVVLHGTSYSSFVHPQQVKLW